jgi:hypothetical protein
VKSPEFQLSELVSRSTSKVCRQSSQGYCERGSLSYICKCSDSCFLWAGGRNQSGAKDPALRDSERLGVSSRLAAFAQWAVSPGVEPSLTLFVERRACKSPRVSADDLGCTRRAVCNACGNEDFDVFVLPIARRELPRLLHAHCIRNTIARR